MTSDTALSANLDDLLNRHFAGKVVRKDLTSEVPGSSMAVPCSKRS